MHKDFLACLATKEKPLVVFQRLCESENAIHLERLESFKKDMETCERIKEALNEKEDSFMYQWADAYRKQAEENEAHKPDFDRCRELYRRKIENELLELKAQEVEELKKHYHSEK